MTIAWCFCRFDQLDPVAGPACADIDDAHVTSHICRVSSHCVRSRHIRRHTSLYAPGRSSSSLDRPGRCQVPEAGPSHHVSIPVRDAQWALLSGIGDYRPLLATYRQYHLLSSGRPAAGRCCRFSRSARSADSHLGDCRGANLPLSTVSVLWTP